MDVTALVCDHIHEEKYTVRHPDAPGALGTGTTPEDACRKLRKAAGKTFKARIRGASQWIGDRGQYDPRNIISGAILFEGEGDTPEEAWKACNAQRARSLRAEADKAER